VIPSNTELVLHSLWPIVRGAILGTIPLALSSFAIGLVIALGVALLRISKNKALNTIGGVYVSIIRGTPLLVQLFIIFYGLPNLGVTIPPWPSAIVAFSLNVGGYAAEVIRAAILSVPKGQWEAAYTVGLSWPQSLRRIILPQALRVAVPPLSNTFISLVKDTSLAAVVLVTELLREAQKIAFSENQFLVLYTEAAAVYWVLCTILSFGQDKLERRLERSVAI
jgi:cystine transport system permease protein